MFGTFSKHRGHANPSTPAKTNMALKMDPWKKRFLLETIIFDVYWDVHGT